MRYVTSWAPVCALIGISLCLISCGKRPTAEEANLPLASTNFVSVTSGYNPVVLVGLPGGNGICTGTFIAKRAVLTAAHCALSSGRYTVTSSFGSFSTSTKVVFGSGSVNDANDIAVLIFSSDVANDSQVYGIGSSVHSGDTLRLVGFGCNNVDTRQGAGVKRTGTNVVASLSEYINFLTPVSARSSRGIIGSDNRAGSCFGDSGGPALQASEGTQKVIGVTHAGGQDGSNMVSEYIDLTRSDNRNFLSQVNANYGLNIAGL